MRIKNFLKRIAFFFLTFIIVLPLSTCKDDEDETIIAVNGKLSGKWEFILIPDQSYQDTSMSHGNQATDFDEYNSSYSEVYLYEDESSNIIGATYGYKISGKRTGRQVELTLYSYPDGPLDESLDVDQMIEFSEMTLSIDEFGYMNGHGEYYDDTTQYWTLIDSYFVEAHKLSDITNADYKSSIKHILCDLASDFAGFLISSLTYGIFRPMANCFDHKDGGGFYAFGHEGPGSIIPIYTQTIYLAWEWSWCKVRKYGFDIDIKGESLGYEALKAEVDKMEPVFHVIDKLGFSSLGDFKVILDHFYSDFGGFAFTAAYDTHTHNMSLYVNHESGSSYDAKHHVLTETIKDALDGLCHDITVYAGKDIHDTFHMRRSDVGVCNSFIIFVYLFGTHNVNYD